MEEQSSAEHFVPHVFSSLVLVEQMGKLGGN